MNYEKAYNEALERAKKWYYAPNADKIPTYANRVIEEIFPELKDSEDEQIRKGLIKALSSIGKRNWGGIDVFESIAWLEKQGKQKPVISDDALIEGIAHFGITQYQIDNWLKKYIGIEKQGEQKPAWSDEDEKMVNNIIASIDTLCYHGMVKWLKSIKDRIQPQLNQKWTEEDENGFGETLLAINKARTIAENENDMGNLWYAENWLKSLKQRIGG